MGDEMKKSIGGKIAVVLSTLALIFVIAMGLNIIALFSILSDSNQAIEEFFFFFETKKEINEICEIFQNKRICQLNLNSIEGYMNNILGNLNEQFHNIVMLYLKVKEKEMKKDKKFKYNVSLITFLDK